MGRKPQGPFRIQTGAMPLLGFPRTFLLLAGVGLAFCPKNVHAQQTGAAAIELVQAAVNAELAADANDHSAWMYRDHDVRPGNDVIAEVVETPAGGLRRTVEQNGHPLTGAEQQAETARLHTYVNDTAAQARDRKNEAHDDAQAAAMLRMLPTAFVWTIKSETADFATLEFRPNPDFEPPNIEAHVMSQMAGTMVIRRPGDHIYTLKGRLLQDIHAGFGLVKLKAGGSFDVERREVGRNHWEIVEQHTHIAGHALLFKTISEQEDEYKSDFRPSPAKTLAEAARLLDAE